jgi:hypothetical protein
MIAALFSRFTHSAVPPCGIRADSSPVAATARVERPTAPRASLSPAYAVLLADRANAQAAYDALSRYPRSTPAKHASKSLWAATCAVLDHERKARVASCNAPCGVTV